MVEFTTMELEDMGGRKVVLQMAGTRVPENLYQMQELVDYNIKLKLKAVREDSGRIFDDVPVMWEDMSTKESILDDAPSTWSDEFEDIVEELDADDGFGEEVEEGEENGEYTWSVTPQISYEEALRELERLSTEGLDHRDRVFEDRTKIVDTDALLEVVQDVVQEPITVTEAMEEYAGPFDLDVLPEPEVDPREYEALANSIPQVIMPAKNNRSDVMTNGMSVTIADMLMRKAGYKINEESEFEHVTSPQGGEPYTVIYADSAMGAQGESPPKFVTLLEEHFIVIDAKLSNEQRVKELFRAQVYISFVLRGDDPVDWDEVNHMAETLFSFSNIQVALTKTS